MKTKKVKKEKVDVEKTLSLTPEKQSNLVSREIESVPNTPFTVVKFEHNWRICLRNNVISLKTFDNPKNAIDYAKRMDSVDVINSVLILINQNHE